MNTYVVLLNWNGWQDTLECLDCLLKSTDKNFSVIVCDNASTDDSIFRLEEWGKSSSSWMRFVSLNGDGGTGLPVPGPAVYLLRTGGNLGFAGGNNAGLKFALRDPESTFFWVLNNDTLPEPSALEHALARMMQDSSIGICGSTLVYADPPEMIQAFGGAVYSRFKGRSRHLGAFLTKSDIPLSPLPVENEMSYVTGAAMLVSRAFIENTGLMEEGYFLYFEELDWAARGRCRFRLGYAPDSIVVHKEGASIGSKASGGSPLSMFYLFRNRIRFCRRFYPWFLPTVFVFSFLDVLKLAVRCRWPQAKAALGGCLQINPEFVLKKSGGVM